MRRSASAAFRNESCSPIGTSRPRSAIGEIASGRAGHPAQPGFSGLESNTCSTGKPSSIPALSAGFRSSPGRPSATSIYQAYPTYRRPHKARGAIVRIAACLLAVALVSAPAGTRAQTTAPPGYHYDRMGLQPNDLCWDPAFASPGDVANVNRSVGKPNGVPAPVVSINDLATASPIAMSVIGISLIGKDPLTGGIACHVTLRFANGKTRGGVLSLDDPGEYAPLLIQWISDATIAGELARVDQLRTSKHLLVVPDLKSPSIQACVARAFSLGADEQFPGQLWAACAQANGSDLIPSTALEKHW